MNPTATAILQDIASALRQVAGVSQVSLGSSGSESVVPRITVSYEGQDVTRPDDSHDTRWVRLKARVTIRTRSQDSAEAVTRIGDLCDLATAAVLADPYRNRLCQDLPIGRATEIDRLQTTELRRPEVEMSFLVRCHFEV